MDMLKEPRQCQNGHLFCLLCISESLKFRKNCPICNCIIDSLSRNDHLERILDEKIVRCCKIDPVPQDCCQWSGYEHDYEFHSNRCQYKELKCQNIGCDATPQRRYYGRHLERCPKKTFNCSFCDSSNISMERYLEHMNQLCYYREICIPRHIPSPMYYNCDKTQYETTSRLCNQDLSPTKLLTTPLPIKSVSWSITGLYIAHSAGNAVPIHNAVTGMLMNTITISSGPIDAFAWCNASNDSASMVIAVATGYIVCVMHALSSRVIAMIISDKKINRISWNPDSSGGLRLVTSGCHQNFTIWNAETGQSMRTQSCEYQVKCIAWSPNGRYIASGCEQIRIWNADTGVRVNLFSNLDMYGPFCLDWSPCSSYIVSTSEGVNIALWAVESGTLLRILEGHCDNIVCLKWSPDGMYIASCSLDKTARVWEASVDSAGACVSILKGHTEAVLSVAWSGDSDYLLSGSSDKQLLLW